MLDLLSKGRGFDSWSGCYQVVTTWMVIVYRHLKS